MFDACVMLNRRDKSTPFTLELLVRTLRVTVEKAKEIAGVLERYGILSRTQAELDSDLNPLYGFEPTPVFIALLIFAGELIDPPKAFSCYKLDRSRPYLRNN